MIACIFWTFVAMVYLDPSTLTMRASTLYSSQERCERGRRDLVAHGMQTKPCAAKEYTTEDLLDAAHKETDQ